MQGKKNGLFTQDSFIDVKMFENVDIVVFSSVAFNILKVDENSWDFENSFNLGFENPFRKIKKQKGIDMFIEKIIPNDSIQFKKYFINLENQTLYSTLLDIFKKIDTSLLNKIQKEKREKIIKEFAYPFSNFEVFLKEVCEMSRDGAIKLVEAWMFKNQTSEKLIFMHISIVKMYMNKMGIK